MGGLPRVYLVFLLALPRLAAAAGPPWGEKALGVLLIGESGGAEWTKTVAAARKAFADRYPVEAVAGLIGPRELQGPIDRLQAAKARKIVVVPVRLYSAAADIDQFQYLLGIKEFPSRPLAGADLAGRSVIPRVKAKVPMTMTGALDEAPVVAAVLAERAREMSREPAKEVLVLVGMGMASEEADRFARKRIDSLAKAAAKEARLLSGRGAALRPERSLMERDAGESSWRRDLSAHPPLGKGAGQGSGEDLREIVSGASRGARALVVPYLLEADGSERLIRKKLDGLFFQWKGKGLLYDDRLVQWIKERVSEGAAAPNMVKFKDAGKALPPPARKKL